jgi:hypothetical protein
MNKVINIHGLAIAFLMMVFSSCTDDPLNSSAPSVPDQSFTEEFETKTAARDQGWVFFNTSVSLGPTDWTNPITPPFAPFSSNSFNGYLWADFNSTTSAAGVISNWAISPKKIFQNGDKISFYTRSEIVFYNDDSTDFVNRLQVRMNTKNDGTDVGNGLNTGDFNIVLLDINPDYKNFSYKEYLAGSPDALLAYPHKWTEFQITISGLPEQPVTGRFAFRYFVEGAGNNGRATSIAIDKLEFTSAHK